jgi:hypothetical protein
MIWIHFLSVLFSQKSVKKEKTLLISAIPLEFEYSATIFHAFLPKDQKSQPMARNSQA